MSLDGKVVLVTGSSRGIGRAVATAFADRGARVIVNSASDAEGGASAVGEIEAHGGAARYVQADASDPADVERLFATAEHEFSPVDILIKHRVEFWVPRPPAAILTVDAGFTLGKN